MRIRTIMTAISLSAFAILSAQTTVIAPEAPFSFEPLQMHSFPAKDYPITKYGAKKGNVKANTQAFARAMAACHKAGGGRVVVPEGEWITGPIHFESVAISICPMVPQWFLMMTRSSTCPLSGHRGREPNAWACHRWSMLTIVKT